MNAVTLDSMAFDHFETAGEDYLTEIEGEGLGLGICLGLVGFAGGFAHRVVQGAGVGTAIEPGYGTIIGALVDGVGQGLIYGGAGFAAGYSL